MMTPSELTKFVKAMRKQGVVRFMQDGCTIELASVAAPKATIRKGRKVEQHELEESIPEDMLLTWSSTPVGV